MSRYNAKIKHDSSVATGSIDLAGIADGMLKSVSQTLQTAVEGTDYYKPAGTDVAIADGGTGNSTAQTAINALTQVSGATNEHVLTKDTVSGHAMFKAVAFDIVNDVSPQLGAMLDVNGFSLGDGTLELLKFVETASAVNEITITNAATGNAPKVSATGDDTNIDLKLEAKGSGVVKLTNSGSTSVIAADSTNADLQLRPNGTGNVTVSDGTDTTKKVSFEVSGATTAKTMTITSSHTDDRTLTLPNATDTLVGKATTDTLTNKTLTTPIVDGTPAGAAAVGYDTTQKMLSAYTGATSVAGAIPHMIAAGTSTAVEINDTAADQNILTLYTFPAGAIYTNKVYRVTVLGETITGTSAVTVRYYLSLGGTKVYNSAVNDVTNGSTLGWAFSYIIMGQAAAGATANVVTQPVGSTLDGSQNNRIAQPVTLATNGTLACVFGVTYSGTGSTESTEVHGYFIEEVN